MQQSLNIATADWGGTNCRSAVIKTDGESFILDSTTYVRCATNGLSLNQVFEKTVAVSSSLSKDKCDGVAVAVAGPVENHGIVLNAPNIGILKEVLPFDLRERLKGLFYMDAIVTNDLEAALAGEVAVGSLKGAKWAMLENIGTGWGGARLYNGVAVAAEPGHVWLPAEDEAKCGCGRMDCAEAQLSGGAIKRAVIDLCSELGINIPKGTHPCEFADCALLEGKDWASDLYGSIAEKIGNIWGSNLNNCPEFQKIAFMGTFLENAMRIRYFSSAVRRAMLERTMFKGRHESIEIVPVQAPRSKDGETLGPLYGNAEIFRQMLCNS